jgi:hypothetical protein
MVMDNESHARWRDRTLADILRRMRHDGGGGRPGRWSWSPVSRAAAAGRSGGSCCGPNDGWAFLQQNKARQENAAIHISP